MAISSEILDEFSDRALKLAAESGRTADEIMKAALSGGLDDWERRFRSLQRGVDQANRGEYVSDEQLAALRNKHRPGA